MLLYILLCIIILFIIFRYQNKEGYKQKKNTSCMDRYKAVERYPKDEHIDILFDAKFKPKCCPSPYSNSSGCLCKDLNHTELIIMRGGNRTIITNR
jgi:hypothetical protein